MNEELEHLVRENRMLEAQVRELQERANVDWYKEALDNAQKAEYWEKQYWDLRQDVLARSWGEGPDEDS